MTSKSEIILSLDVSFERPRTSLGCLITKMASFFQVEWDENLVKLLNYLEITCSAVHKGGEHPRTPHSNRFSMVVATLIFLHSPLASNRRGKRASTAHAT